MKLKMEREEKEMVGIVSYCAYIPIYRLSLEDIGKVSGTQRGKGVRERRQL